MAVLQYDFRIIGMKNIDRALRSMERRFAAHNATVARQMGTTTRARVSPKAKMAGLGKAMNDIGRLAERLERKEYAQKLRNIKGVEAAKIRADKRAHAAAVKNIASEMKARQAFRRSVVGAAGRSMSGAGSAVGRTGTMMAGMGGGMLAAGAIGNQKSVEANAAALANQAFRESPKAGGEMRDRQQIKDSVVKQARDVGHSSGLGATGILEAQRAFVSISGNLGAAQQMTPFLADVSNATDSNVGDVGRTAGQIMQALQARGLGTDDAIAQTRDIMADMAGQAKVGSIEFKELATNMGKLISSTANFDGKASDLVATMGAMGQIAIAGGAASAEEAMTALKRFADDAGKNYKKFDTQGINVFANEEQTKLKAPEEVLFQAIEKSGGSIPIIQSMFGIRSKKAVEPFATRFSETKAAALKGGASEEEANKLGADSLRALMKSVRDARVGPKEMSDSARFRETQGDRDLSRSMEELNAAIGRELLPTFIKLAESVALYAPEIAGLMSAMAGVVEYLLDNPFTGIGAIIVAKIGADVAMAGIGKAIMARIGVGAAASAAGGVSMGAAGGATAGGVGALLSKGGSAVAGAGAVATGALAVAATGAVAAAFYQFDKLATEVGGGGSILARAAKISEEPRGPDSWGFGGHELVSLFDAVGGAFSDTFAGNDADARIGGVRQTSDGDKAWERMHAENAKANADAIAAKQLEAAEKQLEAAKLAKEAAGAGVNTGSGPTEPREGGGKK